MKKAAEQCPGGLFLQCGQALVGGQRHAVAVQNAHHVIFRRIHNLFGLFRREDMARTGHDAIINGNALLRR